MANEAASMTTPIVAAPAVVVFFEAHGDEQRGDLGLKREIAGDEDDAAVFADGTAKGERHAGERGGQQRGKNDARERLPAVRAETGGGFFDIHREIGDDGLQGAHDERKADKRERDGDAERRIRGLDVVLGQPRADPAIRRIQRDERDARDGGGQRKRQIDHGIEHATAWKRSSAPAPRP
jgi:hypothetical protein